MFLNVSKRVFKLTPYFMIMMSVRCFMVSGREMNYPHNSVFDGGHKREQFYDNERRGFSSDEGEESHLGFKDSDMVAIDMRGIPFRASEEDIYAFFSSFEFVPKSVKIGFKRDMRKSGYASILFKNEEQATSALKELQGKEMGHRWIELFPHDYGHWRDFNAGLRQDRRANNNLDESNVQVTEDNYRNMLTLYGLPYDSNEDDIADFMKDHNVDIKNIAVKRSNGRSIGKAVVQMNSPEEVMKAVQDLDNKYIGSRYVKLRPATFFGDNRDENRNEYRNDYRQDNRYR
jgi:RNA recognition motif-containing protein